MARSFRFLAFHDAFLQRNGTARVISDPHRSELRAVCKSIRTPAGPSQSFSTTWPENDLFVPGTPPVLLTNATIWTGTGDRTEIVYGDVLLDRGLVIADGYIPPRLLDSVISQVALK